MKKEVLIGLSVFLLVVAVVTIFRGGGGREVEAGEGSRLDAESGGAARLKLDSKSRSQAILSPEQVEADWQSLFADYSDEKRWSYSDKFLMDELEKVSVHLFLDEVRRCEEFNLELDKLEVSAGQPTPRKLIETRFMDTWSHHMEKFAFGLETEDWIFLLGFNRWETSRRKFLWISIRKEDWAYVKWDSDGLYLK